MDVYVTDQDQIEAIKKWWKENWKALLVGLIVGVGALLAWRSWQQSTTRQAEEASSRFEQLMADLGANKTADAEQKARELIRGFAPTPYASFAALALARMAVEANDLLRAKEHLQWVLDHSNRAEFKRVARMRLARVYLAENNAERAWSLVEPIRGADKLPSYQELKGDILAVQGKVEEARKSYRQALALLGAQEGGQSALQSKLDDLGGEAAAPAQAQ